MTVYIPTAEERGEHLRLRYGIDGTMGDAQDVDHPFHANFDAEGHWCLVCGLAQSYRKHGVIHLVGEQPGGGWYACDPNGTDTDLQVPMTQRTKDVGQATCPGCLANAEVNA